MLLKRMFKRMHKCSFGAVSKVPSHTREITTLTTPKAAATCRKYALSSFPRDTIMQ